jgi:hypothetical protein
MRRLCFVIALAATAAPRPAAANHCATNLSRDIGPFMAQPNGSIQYYSNNCTGQSGGCADYFDITLLAGQTLLVTTCSSYGASAAWDTGFAAWNTGMTTNYQCIDDSCGLQTLMTQTAGPTTTYRIKLGGFGTASGPYTFAYQAPVGAVIGGGNPDSDNDGDPNVTDCDDTNPAIYNGAPESCDNIDSNCNGSIVDTFANWDGDAIPDCVDTDDDNDGDPDVTDCDDYNASVYNGATEYCDNLDSNCDGSLVDGYPNNDLDAEPDCLDADDDNDLDPDVTDCADFDPLIHNGAQELCNTRDDDCDGVIDEGTPCYDDDGDGFTEQMNDCNDGDATVYPGAFEVCDGVDEDCDGTIDDGTPCYDDDGDGFTEQQGDCWDGDAATSPNGIEDCDGVDDDCDGTVDEGTSCFDDDQDGYTEAAGDCDDANAAWYPSAIEVCDGFDEDCDGIADDGTSCVDDDGDGFSEDDGDCDDGDETIYPGATESDDGVDENCDGIVDEGQFALDEDGDGTTVDGGDCDDLDASVHPGAWEDCDGIDQDCDGVLDEGTQCYDDDGDGFTEDAGDCDDSDASVAPDIEESCDGRDEDCDGEVDEDGPCADNDGDGFNENGGDCDDLDDAVFPGGEEACDGVDNDCDGEVDEQGDCVDQDGDGFAPGDGDCDDLNPWVYVGADDVCDGIDNDCDGTTDPGCGDGEVTIEPPPVDAGGCEGCAGGATVLLPLLLLAGPLSRRRSGLLLALLAISPLAACNDETAVQAAPAQLVILPDAVLDLGPVAAGQIAVGSVLITNVGSRTVDIAAARLDGGDDRFTVTADGVGALAPGSAVEVVVSFQSQALSAFEAELSVVFAGLGEGSAVHSWAVRAFVAEGHAQIVPPRLDLGFVPAGETAEGEVIVRNTSAVALLVDGGSIDAPGWELMPPEGGFPLLLPPHEDGTLVVRYTPSDDDEAVADLTLTGSVDLSSELLANRCPGSVHPSWNDDGDGFSVCGGDCDDTDDTVHPGAAEWCNLEDDDCDGMPDDGTECGDDDGDGYTEVDGDCDDSDASVFPGATESADGRDSDCDGLVPAAEGPDQDGDGFAPDGGDCADGDATRNPAAVEVCDTVDQDCDGTVDEGTPCYDDDGDGLSEDDGDCADDDATALPGATDVSNGRDDDCDGLIDEDGGGYDGDGDGFTPSGGDCDDADAGVNPAEWDQLGDGIDADCDGVDG